MTPGGLEIFGERGAKWYQGKYVYGTLLLEVNEERDSYL
jgi:hypothetical protein